MTVRFGKNSLANPGIVAEMIGLSTETPVLGKYVLGFFEELLLKLLLAGEKKTEEQVFFTRPEWNTFWTPYLEALASPDEQLRSAVCTHVTPLIVKLDKNSLAHVL